MGITKMKYINVYGPEKKLNSALLELARLECFHPDLSGAEQYRVNTANNRYEPLLTKAQGLLADLGEELALETYEGADFHAQEVDDYLEKFATEIATRLSRKAEIQAQLQLYSSARVQLYHLAGLTSSVDDIFTCTFLKVRFGRLPRDSYNKLSYYEDKHFTFTVYDFNGDYYWGVYFAPTDNSEEIDGIFSALNFERIWVPDFVHGKPQDALDEISKKETELTAELAELQKPGVIASREEIKLIKAMTLWLNTRNQLFEMRHCATLFNHTFYVSGFVPEEDYTKVTTALATHKHLKFSEQQEGEGLPVQPPVKLKNGWFSKPYEMYVSMYGLPVDGDFDPTFFVAITYSIFFGIMFGDVGQGIVIALAGFIMQKYKKMQLGGILMRAGFFSVIFGFIYGSVFGFEEALDPLYHALGMSGKPLHVLSPDSIMLILMSSVAIGIVIVTSAIILGVVSKIRRKDYGEAIFSPNGAAGLVFYVSLIVTVANALLLHLFEINAVYIIVLLVIPFICMYFSEPLAHWVNTGKLEFESVGGLILNGFFEMFDTLLSFITNTLSFLRVGGFVLCHAGMMSVVFTLATTVGGFGFVLVLIIGNIFVICIEGLIVGIQALRLEFYEVFSRFFEADAVPYSPLKLQTENIKNNK